MKEVDLTAADISGDTKIFCTLTGTCEGYGSVAVDDNLMVTHTRGAADANDTLSIVDGNLVANSDNVYALDGNDLNAEYPRLNGSVTANASLYTKSVIKTVEFKYNASGMRVQKIVTVGSEVTTTNYIYHGKILMGMTVGSDTLHFYYDAQSRPTKVDFNGTVYTYVHNLQGDVVGILDNVGTLVVEYKYDAWGRMLGTGGTLANTLGKLDPFRYRGYVFDEECGFYYLRNRYYDISRGRFINADIILNYNVYAYCKNTPINKMDKNGTSPTRAYLSNIMVNDGGGGGRYYLNIDSNIIPYTLNPFRDFGIGLDLNLPIIDAAIIKTEIKDKESRMITQNLQHSAAVGRLGISTVLSIFAVSLSLPLLAIDLAKVIHSEKAVKIIKICATFASSLGVFRLEGMVAEDFHIANGDFTTFIGIYDASAIDENLAYVLVKNSGFDASSNCYGWNFYGIDISNVSFDDIASEALYLDRI